MLIQFRVENHRSLRDEQVLSLSASPQLDGDDARLLHQDALADPLLPTIGIYGANASGKTNVLHALQFMHQAVMSSHRQWDPAGGPPIEPFLLSKKRREAPSLYEVDVVVDGARLRYGFVLGKVRVEEEWLFAWPKGKKQTWFEREGESFSFGRHLRGDNDAIRALTRPNSLFLSAAAQNNHERLLPLFRWFRRLSSISVGTRTLSPFIAGFARLGRDGLSLATSSLVDASGGGAHERALLLEILKAADVGIEDVRLDVPGASEDRGAPRAQLLFRHKTEDGAADAAWLPLELESAGTVALVGLAPRLTAALRQGTIVCIDELEASLHPMLALSLLRLFHDPKSNPRGAQLIFTTHDTNLLGNVLGEPPLRRDQIWFTEKDSSGATLLYPLTDYHPRKQENLERGYLQGRYGAIPFLGDLAGAPGADGDDRS